LRAAVCRGDDQGRARAGFLRETEDAYLFDGPLSRLAIPTSLHDSLMARLDRLQPVEEVDQTAAVIGRAFEHQTINGRGVPPRHIAAALGWKYAIRRTGWRDGKSGVKPIYDRTVRLVPPPVA
jgi:hypothetical protein